MAMLLDELSVVLGLVAALTARAFGVCEKAVALIGRREIWGYLPEKPPRPSL